MSSLVRSRGLALTVCLALLVTLFASVRHPTPAAALVRDEFNPPVFSADDNGAIAIVGNSQLSCPTATAGCDTARSGTTANNNSYAMAFLDTDGVASTTNSTSADVSLPAGSQVLYARLIWGARVTAASGGSAATGQPGSAKLRAPGQSAYAAVTGTVVQPSTTLDGNPYQASLDVTTIVRSAGNGTYWFADMAAATGADRYAGWSLIIAYRNPSLPLRNLSIFEGFADISTSVGNTPVNTVVSGFLTPATGTVNATVGLLAWEGDAGTTGDTLKLNGTTLTDAQRPSNNTFDSRISTFGVNNADRNPSYLNNLGVDMGRVGANGVLANGSTAATVQVNTTGDTIYLGALTTEIDLYTPSFVGVSKSVVDLNGNSPAKVGDTLEYRLSYTNSGQDFADNVVARDQLPANVSYVPGSLTVVSGPNAGVKTDSPGDDVGDYTAADRTVRVRLGTGATATAGGTVNVNAGTSLTFRVTVDRAAAGTTVTNGSFLDYRARTLARDYSFVTNTVSTPVQEIADLAITKTSSPTSQTAGSRVTYTLVVTDNGPNAGTNLVTTDTLPTGLSYVSSDPPSGTTCSASGQTVSCATATLANGASLVIPIVAAIDGTAGFGTAVDQATVAADTADDVPANNTAAATTTITRSADLYVTKSAPASAAAGSTVTYRLTVGNNGPSTVQLASLSDPLPGGLSVVSTTTSQGTCTSASQTVTCALGRLASGDTASVTIVARVGAAFTGSSVVNSATVTSATPDDTADNNTATTTTTVTRSADLAVTKTASPATVVAGTTGSFTITVANNGPSDAAGVELTDPLPAGLQIVGASTTQGSCATTTPVRCVLGTITPDTSVRITLSVRALPTAAAGAVTNTANATSTTPDPAAGNDSGSASVTIQSRADLSVTKSAAPNPIQPGNPLTYTLSTTNAGPSQARGATIVDTLPAGVSFLSGDAGCTVSGQTVTCPVGSVDVGATATRQITVSTPDTVPGGTLTNTARVTSDNDPSTDNNTATFVSSLDPQADVSLTKTAGPTPLVAGGPVTFTLAVRNAGPSSASEVTVTDPLPATVTAPTASVTGGGGSCTVTGQTVSCPLGTLASGGTRTITVTGTVAAGTTATDLTNTARVASSSPNDPTTSNNTATSTSVITTRADVAVTLTALTPTVRAGEEATFEVAARNNGPSTARDVVVSGQVPDGMEPVPGSSGGACTVTGRTVTCAIRDLPVGASGTLRFRALVLPSTPAGPISGTAFIGSSTPDPVAGNNSDPETVTVVTAADLVAVKAATPSPIVAGSSVLYTLTATNRGPSDASAVTLSDTLPAGLSIDSVDPSAGTCTVTGQQITCAADRLAPSAVLTVRVRASTPGDLTGTVTNAVTVGSAVSDPLSTNNTATISTPVTQSADLRLTKTASPEPVLAGTSLSYTLTAVNTGPSRAAAVVLDDALPAGLTVLPAGVAAPDGVTCTVAADGGSVRCQLGDLAPGAQRSITVSALVPGVTDDGTELVNTATLTSPTPSQDPAGRTATVRSTVGTSADLAVTKTATQSSPIAGGPETYVLTVVNNGPSLARGVTVRDTLPDGVSYVSAVDPGGRCDESDGTVTCALGDLTFGEIAVVQVTVTLDDDIAGRSITDRATVDSDTDDPVTANDSASLTQPVSAQSDLAVTKVVVGDPPVAGGTVSYRITVVNHGPSLARAVRAADVLPPGLGYSAAAASDDGSCLYLPNAQTVEDDDAVECSWDSLAVDDSVTATLTFTVPDAIAPGSQIVNTATAGSAAIDPTPATATVRTPVTTSADLSTTKTLLSGAPVAGQEVRWQAVVHNAGPSVARAVRLADSAPAGVTFGSAETAQGDCTVVPAAVSCALGDLPVGASLTVTLSGRLDQGFAGSSLTNTATATSTTPDPDLSDNSGTTTTPTGALADLGVTKTATPATVVAGQDVTWTVTTVNAGPSTARSVLITDELPPGVTLVSQQLNAPGSCAPGSTVVCRVATLVAGGSAAVTIVARVDPGYPSPTLANTASATSSVADPDPLDNSATATSPVDTSADLSVSKTGPDSAVAGGPISWQVTASNAGPSDATDVVVTDTLPPGVGGVTGTFAGGSCSVTGLTVRCPLGTLGPASDTVVTISGTIAPDTSSAQLANTVQVSSPTPDPDAADRTATAVTTLTRSADLTIAKTATTGAFTAGDRVGWTVDVVNHGPSLAAQVRISDALPVGVNDVTVDQPGCTVTDGTLTCTLDGLAPGGRLQIPVTGLLDAGFAGATLTNTAAVTSATPDDDLGDNSATAATPVTSSADLSVGKSVTSGPPVAGDPITYRVVVTNHGPSDATQVVLTDPVPDTVSGVTATSDAGPCTVDEGAVRCQLGTVPDGAQAIVELRGTVGQDFDQSITNRATATAATDDPDPGDNTGTATATVGESADVGVTKTGPATATAGSPISWTLTVSNSGPSTARDVRLTVTLPAGVGEVDVEPPDGVSCSTEVVCTLGSIAAGDEVVVRVTGRIAAALAATTLVNNAGVSSATPDPDSTNETASSSTTITRAADLSIAKDVDPGTLTPGQSATYRLRVSNAGPSVATGVQVTDVLPDGLSLDPAGPSSDDGDCAVIGRTVSCALRPLAPGRTETIVVPVLVDSAWTASSITNTASVSATTADPEPGNDTVGLTSPLAPRADLTLDKTAPAEVVAGDPLTWQLKVTNAGPSDAQQVVVTDRLPVGVGEVYARSTQGSCTQDGRTLTCVIGLLAAGSDVTVDLGTVGGLDPSYPTGRITNTATVASPTPDTAADGDGDGDQPGADSRSDSADTVVGAVADVTVVKTPLSSTAQAGGTVGWRVTVVDNGPSTARDVVVTDPPVAGLDDVTVTPPAGVRCDDDGRCRVGTLLPGADAALTFTVTARVPADFAGQSVVNTARADSSTDDPDPGDNRSSSPVIIGRAAGLSIVKSPTDAVAVPGRPVSWTVRVHNAGPSVATAVEVTDTLPPGVSDVTVDAPDGVDCSTAATLTCSIDRVAVGTADDVLITVTGRLAADYAGRTLTNTAQVTSDTPDADLADNSSTATHRVVPAAGVSITKTGPGQVTAGQRLTYGLTVRNDGPSTARNVVVTDPLPAALGSVTAGVDDESVACQVVGSTVSCAVGDLADGGRVQITVTGTVAADTTAATLTNVATASSDTPDPDPDDNTSDPVVTTVLQSADLAIVKTVSPDPIQAGRPATFRLEVRNSGPSVARSVTVTDPVSAELTVTGASSSVGSCTTAQTVVCALGDLPMTADDAPVVIEITVDVSADADPAGFANTASVLSQTPDPRLGNNTSSLTGDTATEADLSVTKTADVDTVRAGRGLTWTVAVHNAGPASARAVTLVDPLPAGVTVTSIEPAVGTCTATDRTPVTCVLGTMAPDATVTVTVEATVDPAATVATIVNAVSVSSATGDPAPANNVAQSSTPLVSEADLRLTKTADSPTVVAGGPIGWTLTVTNDGPAVARSVVLSDPLPAEVSAGAPTGCTLAAGALSCAVGDLVPGASATVTLTGTVSASAVGPISNTATVAAATTDPETGDNTATSTTSVTSRTDLSVTKTADATDLLVGDAVAYTITVTNSGPSDALAVRVQEAWPAGLQLVSDDPSQGNYDPRTQLWSVGTLPVDATATLVLTGEVRADGTIANTVTASTGDCGVAAADLSAAGPVCDVNPADNIATATISADNPPDESPGGSSGSGGSGGSSGSGGSDASGRLPNTGGPGLGSLLGGLVLVGAGGALLLPGRWRRRRS